MAATRTGGTNPVPSEALRRRSNAPAVEVAVQWLRDRADDQGVVAPDLRALASSLGTRTVTARALVVALVARGVLRDLGSGAYGLTGSPVVDLAPQDLPPGPRLAPHDGVHEGSGGVLYW